MSTKFKFLLIAIFASCSLLYAEPTNYTYNYDFWKEQVASPDAYRVSAYLLGANLRDEAGRFIGHFNQPEGLFIRDEHIYVCDTNNNRIVKIDALENGDHIVTAVFSAIKSEDEAKVRKDLHLEDGARLDAAKMHLNGPTDIFENSSDRWLYIADKKNNRVLIMDYDWNYIHAIYKPEDDSLRNFTDNDDELQDFVEFIPNKLIVDYANRVFVKADTINKGLMEFNRIRAHSDRSDPDAREWNWEFAGFMGANKVKVNMLDYIWKLLSTQAQRARMELFVPTEYSNLALDKDGFVYVTNSTVQTDPVRRLNAMGQDILIRNGYENPIGDLSVGNTQQIRGPSQFIDVVAFHNDSYACFDKTRGRIFMYDFQGNLLYAFGGRGNREGYFSNEPAALDRMGSALYALDKLTGAVTRFDLTEYGILINKALDEYKAGRYEQSAEVWEEVLKRNGNYDLAYIGIGRAALRQGDYQKAMRYYKLKHYREGYGKAFQLYRKIWMEENLWWILIIIGALVLLPPCIRLSIKTVKEIREA